ncbi:basic amino acid ABC transporter substrate-binding protein [Pelagicoccus sp. SDUM812002]|uniref:basic amino acid ABC transporter substrate-binding protein n=1 Tax=Pelagicoccus sp. SDUM812002 TaxID=3041266 RepID=UPI00280D3BCD|nr:basic amino acid ABC transporter substrate-binding protein [Pelagicoccus sp. SDUM812002]MDQ8186484.1 basic amino acid ABC transporter substrate-binding protein [Pelagicoccus sp. SDUM812002]
MQKWFWSGVILLAGSVLLTACGGGAKDGALLVGTEATYPPFEMTNDAGEIVGFDIDLIKAIAADQGLILEFRDMDFDSLVPAVQGGNIDIAVSGMSITPLRQKQVAFTDPYIEAGLVVAVGPNAMNVGGVDDLKGLRIAVQQGTTGAAKTEELLAAKAIGSVKYFPNVSVAMMELLNGGVDAVINDKPVTEAFVAKHPDKIKIVGETLASDEYGFALAKGREELLAKLNAGLANVKADGTWDQLATQYFGDASK